MRRQEVFPFVAVVGQEQVKRALLIAVVNPKAGGLLIGGAKGTAKSVLVRSLQEFATLVELPLNVTEDMLFGSIDMEQTMQKGKRVFLSGILERATNNILYLDETNLLRTELLTAVLNVNAAGVNLIERDGISYSHPVQYTVIGTMNPEEGTLPGHILDRFGLYTEANNEIEIPIRVKIMESLLAYERDRQEFCQSCQTEMDILREQIVAAKQLLDQVAISEAMMQLAAKICERGYCAGHRAELYLLEAAKAIAALADRDHVLPHDVEEAAQYVLPHRMRQPPDPPQAEQEQQDEQEDQEENKEGPEADTPNQSSAPEENDQQNKEDKKEEENTDQTPDNGDHGDRDQVADIDRSFPLPKMIVDLGQDRHIRKGSGKRSTTRTDLKQGRYVRANMPQGKVEDLAFDATIRAAAPYQSLRERKGCALNIQIKDLRQKVREKRIGNTFLFLVDASGSMGARERMKAVKGAIFSMLQEAYQKRDRVGMIAFRRRQAEVLLPITRSVDLAQKCLKEMPTGGKTPLAEGLSEALSILTKQNKRDKEMEPILILLTDGRANVTQTEGEDPVKQALQMAEKIQQMGITAVVIDTETDFVKLGVAKKIARTMGATYSSLQQLSEEQILRIVRNLTEEVSS